MNKRMPIIIISLMATFSLLVACGSNATSSSAKEKEVTTKTRSIKQAMGTAQVPDNPKKVVILTNEGTEALLSLGVNPVGAVKSWKGDPWYDYIADDMKGVKDVGLETEPNVEAIATLEPDLIIGNKVRHEKIYDQLNQIAPTVFAEKLSGNWKENLLLYAKTVNKEKEGTQLVADFDKRVDSISQKLGNQKEKKVSIVRFLAGQSRIYYTDSFPGIILKDLGFKHSEKQEKLFSKQKDKFMFATDSKENIPDMDGDVLFYFTYTADDNKENIEWTNKWTNDPLWKNLKAVKSKNAYEVDDIVWTTAGGIKAANMLLDDIETYFLKK
ncbi:iron-siderophore ABC transporter substrate-binding protein [Bacillus sp. FJAT-53060]|uniref:ABC transporter substrate-binding protein n=1 Tax=Bacillus sp. FJAT-53060 TaxID=3127666 RepID=UPI0030141CFD